MIQSRIKNLVNTRPIALILLIFLAFIALGMPDGLLGVGWPSIRAGFGQPLDAIGMLLFTIMLGYLTSSFLSGALTQRWGVGKLLIIGTALRIGRGRGGFRSERLRRGQFWPGSDAVAACQLRCGYHHRPAYHDRHARRI